MADYIGYISLGLFVLFLILALVGSIRIVSQVDRGVIVRFGKYNRPANVGLNFKIPIFEQVITINITEQLVDAGSQEIITKDKLNARVDAQVYFKVRDTPKDVFNSLFNVANCKVQIVALARTTLRNIIGTMTLNEANGDRNKINSELMATLLKETSNWGIEVVRTELKEIDPPKDVQETMNSVVIAENKKQAALDFATAKETEADGARRAEIKKADGIKQALILQAEGEAQAKILVANAEAKKIELVSQSLQKNFKNEAIQYKQLETFRDAFKDNAKFIIDPKLNIVNVMSDMAGVKIPLPVMEKDKKK